MSWLDLPHTKDHCEDPIFKLGMLKEKFTVESLIEDELWVAHDNKPEGEDKYCWLNFAFFESDERESPSDDWAVSLLMHGHGPTGILRECRHTYWGRDGYIFYPNKKHIVAALEWLEKYFDL